MAVARMKKFQIAGPKRDLDILSYDIIDSNFIQLIDAEEKTLKKTEKRENPYNPLINEISHLLADLGIEPENEHINIETIESVDLEQIKEEIKPVANRIIRLKRMKKRLDKETDRLHDLKQHIWLMRNMDLNLDVLKNLSYISLIFGSVSLDDYERLIKNIVDLPILILEVNRNDKEVWFFTFTKKEHEEKALNILDSVYFERIELPQRVKGQPRDILNRADHRLNRINQITKQLEIEYEKLRQAYRSKLSFFYHQLKLLDKINEIGNQYYEEADYLFLLNGWIPETREVEFQQRLEGDFNNVIYTSQEVKPTPEESPPIVLHNFSWVKPFESLVKLYGTPRYNEIDPSLFMAITYILMFGMMFGDVGQGLIFALIGLSIRRQLLKIASPDTGLLLMSIGLSSTVFGFLYGSFFGMEDIIPAFWLRPMENIVLWLGIAVGFGISLILVSMVINLINAQKRNDIGEFLFSRNGLAGLWFYLFALVSLVSYLVWGNLMVNLELTLLFLIVPLILILFREPLANFVGRNERIWPEKTGEYFLESGFELFDAVISYLSNTISFVRIGAFTLNHVGLSMAVFILAGMIENSFGSIFVIVLGNIIIMGLEGLVVGIQVLRLEYFELFGKFYQGDGEEFSPINLN